VVVQICVSVTHWKQHNFSHMGVVYKGNISVLSICFSLGGLSALFPKLAHTKDIPYSPSLDTLQIGHM
jgi:hypothetical protein